LHAQSSDTSITINSKFELRLDSIARRITINKWGTDTLYFIHHEVKNRSNDTLTYITNSCFYYNHYSLKVGEIDFDLNPDGDCLYNSTTPHKLAPNESFRISQIIFASNLYSLREGEFLITLTIPLVNYDNKTYRVDGRPFVENEELLIFNNNTKIIETIVNNKKRKKVKS
jgi:hypothetical protein